jgi:hypothetical protein
MEVLSQLESVLASYGATAQGRVSVRFMKPPALYHVTGDGLYCLLQWSCCHAAAKRKLTWLFPLSLCAMN